VSFAKIKKTLNYKTDYFPKEGAKEVYDALKEGKLNPDDPKTITVKWYRNLLEMHAFLKDVEVKGAIL
jgi:hypothetical protein